MDVSKFLNISVPPLLERGEILDRAIAYRDAGWSVYCCTALVGYSDHSDEYVEPHWLIQAIEANGWHLDRLDYITVDLDRRPQMLGDAPRPQIRIEAKLMFRRTAVTDEGHDQ